jgi:tyrosine-protein phosphatase SIW14
MLNRIGFNAFIASLLLLVAVPAIFAAPPAEIPSNGNIPRFSMVADGLYRGGQPTEKGFQLLKQRGIKTVINLRMEYDEAGVVQKYGMNYVQIPIDEVRPWSQIPQAAVAKYFEVVNNPANYPIFVHCQRGADRTGVITAFYRMAIQGWDAKKAYSEARDIGMRWWYAGLKTQLYDFHPPERAKLQPAMEPK